MASIGKIARRTFLVGAAAVAGGVAFGYYKYRQPYENPLAGRLDEGEATFNPWVKIGADNTITVYVPRAEMGQGVSTTLAALVAEELDVRLEQLTVEHGPAAAAYYNGALLSEGAPYPAFDHGIVPGALRSTMRVVGKFLALQVTGGSTATIDAFEKMRHAGALAREMLKAEAAERMGVSVSALATADAVVSDSATGNSLTYGDLAAGAAKRSPPSTLELRSPSDWKLLRKAQPRVDMTAKVTGAPIFGIDVKLEGMKHATVRMNPKLGGKLVSLDASEALAMRGVEKVIEIRHRLGEGYAVIADNTWRAFQAADRVRAEWGEPDRPLDTQSQRAVLQAALEGPDGFALRTLGDPETTFADAPADKVVTADYSVPFLAHATMEPMNATAWLRDGKLDVWAPNQAPTILRQTCAEAAGVEESATEIHTTHLGGGFGRRSEFDYAVYATLVAREADGAPVKVTWTREEDTRHDFYRPMALARYRARLGDDGFPQAIDGTVASPSIIKSLLGRLYPDISPLGPDKSIIDGSWDQPYAPDHFRVTGKPADLGVPIGFWRAVGASHNPFFSESFIDEVAARGGIDPLDLRLKLASPYKTAVTVLEKVAEMSGWRNGAPAGRARGLAFCLSFGTWVAQVVEVSGDADNVRIEKVWCAADPGLVLDPAIFEAQMMSGIVFGLSAATGQAITFADGAVEQSNFHDFDAMRINQCPDIAIALTETADHMGGAGEPGTPPAAPALANAVFALTGKRIRDLPLSGAIGFA